MKKSQLKELIKEEINKSSPPPTSPENTMSKEDLERVKRYLEDNQWMKQIKDRDRKILLSSVNFILNNFQTISKYS